MSYNIQITGHKDGLSGDEGREFEEGIVSQAKQFVAGLDGLTSATLSGQHVGSVNLKDEE